MSAAVFPSPPRPAAVPVLGRFPFLPFLERFDVWEYVPMDQGGRLVQLGLIGSEKDAEIVRAIRQPGFFAQWGPPGVWDALENSEREKSVWLNRWYFLPSLAHEYARTREDALLGELLGLVRKWWAENPVPEDRPAYFATRRYNWRDMQVAWRAHNLVWSYFLIRDGLQEEDAAFLREVIAVHGEVLLEYFGSQPLHENNHQSHGALAMLAVGLLFPKHPLADLLVERSRAMLSYHLEHAFLPDGNSIELCPGYYPFIASIFRDAWLLCQANNVEPPARSWERMKQFRDYLQAVVQPDGTVPPINDSSEMDARVSLAVLEEILGSHSAPAGSRWLQSSGQATLRQGAWYAFLDAGPTMLWHWHGGKLGFHLWHGTEPLLVDSGICNYDDPLRLAWYCTPGAHNTLLIDGRGDRDRADIPFADKQAAGSQIIAWETTAEYDLAILRHTGFPTDLGQVEWLRYFILMNDGPMIIVDRLVSDRTHCYDWFFHFAPEDIRPHDSGVRAFGEQQAFDLISAALEPPTLSLTSGYRNRQGKNQETTVAKFSARTSSLAAAFALSPANANFASLQVKATEANGPITARFQLDQPEFVLELPAWPQTENKTARVIMYSIQPIPGNTMSRNL